MSQLKFVRSKSTNRSNPLGKIQQKLKQVQKPGKLHVSVGRSRQSSQTREDLLISNPKLKTDQQVSQHHHINRNGVSLQASDAWQLKPPLSHDAGQINNSRKFSNSSQYNGNLGNIYSKQHYYTQTTCCTPKLSESENIFKFDTLQIKTNKLNSTDQKTMIVSDTNPNSTFNFNQFAPKQSRIINQDCNLEEELFRVQSSVDINTKIKQNQVSNHEQIKLNIEKIDQIILDRYPAFTKKNLVNTKPIIEQNENEDLQAMKFSTKSSQRQIPKSFSEILTERSIVLNLPKEYKETDIQTSFSQYQESEPKQQGHARQVECKSTTNASVQTKTKNRNLGLFQYQLSFFSPKVNRNFVESDLISLDDYQQQIIYGNQQENKTINQQLRDIDLNQYLRSQILSQKNNNLTMNLDSIEDPQHFNLQAEPKEINTNLVDNKFNNNRSVSLGQNSCSSISKSKIEKEGLFQSSKCYKDHLSLLTNQTSQEKKQRYPLRNSNQSYKKQQRPKQTKKK
ncbi:unnamed protein product (macronuclear) [Paramecium tetraurelia]|uniref:Uncharacterized protein n=1 Tax=Paramecium tetraurelia TaxID=5888 RepID=A0C2A8_PARTE|nr:uncharacterized protein GSPATT00034402001 [Paramecium tetraurelia]CAK64925.1 unnamed protein product [Paramecium tetraurelia]|eukprot:XP_001432322.1 hypothetical protein (macronuclear) [Paramecium tetraurelia strain d4-2]